jgi:hypothetical protein
MGLRGRVPDVKCPAGADQQVRRGRRDGGIQRRSRTDHSIGALAEQASRIAG